MTTKSVEEAVDTAGTEWSTLSLIFFCLAGWLGAGMLWTTPYWIISLPVMAVLTAFFASLQHETIHGHPTPYGWLNELLVSLPLGLIFPYRRYRDLHLKHHNDADLTDPYEDPESYFWPLSHYRSMRPLMRRLFEINNTFAGRLAIGPALTVVGFFRTELRRLVHGEPGIRKAWALHAAGVAVMLTLLIGFFAMPVWVYIAFVAYPAASLISMRSYAEHQAAENIGGRTAVVEAGRALSLLYLNNNLHIVHHAHPQVPWYDIPKLYRERKRQYLAANGNLLFLGYSEVAKRFGFRVKQPVDHPFLYRHEAVSD